jgi:hypothetical protein
VQHFWLCSSYLNIYTLEYQSKRGVRLRNLLGISTNLDTIRFIAAAQPDTFTAIPPME